MDTECHANNELGLINLTTLIQFMGLAVAPIINPISQERLLLTYILPVVLIVSGWDSLVSQLKACTPEELYAITQGLGDDRYQWESDRISVPRTQFLVICFVGLPLEGD